MKKPKPKRPVGHPPYQPTDQARNTVRTMVAAGIPEDIICKCLAPPCSKNTLRKHFERELETSAPLADASVAGRMHQMALTSPNPAWAIFWLKCRAGWKERHQLEHTGKDGAKLMTLADLDRIVQGPEE